MDSVVCKSSDLSKLHQSYFAKKKKCGPVVLNNSDLFTFANMVRLTKLVVKIIT